MLLLNEGEDKMAERLRNEIEEMQGSDRNCPLHKDVSIQFANLISDGPDDRLVS
jgi:hypothetical protein